MAGGDLKEIRRRIDEIDENLIKLLAERLRISRDIAVLKKKLGAKIRDEVRERYVIDRARNLARELGIDPDFIESVMRLVMAQMVGEEKLHLGGVGVWNWVQQAFRDYPAQMSVARVMFKYGLRVLEDGTIACGNIRIPAVQIAKEAGVDRRVVDATARRILNNRKLREIFENLEPIAYLKGFAQQLGLGVIEIIPEDASRPGILEEVTGVIAKFGLSIRQSVTDDPHFVPQPKLTIITDEPVKGKVIEALRRLPSVRSVIVY
ncbi:MAG: chorismate mutase [Candidatus Hadarchaeum sp.]|uniref:chorismate mutase n=1 Tax=Candidatus Hadarchaeum sp. TaxID=2883567 RepID=UPI003D0E5638